MRVLLLSAWLAGCGFDAPRLEPDAPPALGPWGPPQLVELGLDGAQGDPSLTADGLHLFFGLTGDDGEDVMHAARATTGDAWTDVELVDAVSSPADETTGRISADGRTFLFASNRGTNHFRLYRAERPALTDPFTNAVIMAELDGMTSNEYAPALAPDGLAIILCSDRGSGPPGERDENLYRSTRTAAGRPWTPPAPIAELASPVHDCDAWTPDDYTLYFVRGTDDDTDLYIATRALPSGPYDPPRALAELNSEARETDPWVSADGRTIYFASTREGGGSRIFVSTR